MTDQTAFKLEAKGLTRCFQTKNRHIELLHGLSLKVTQRQIACVLGVSGSGKSTLLSLLAGLDLPDKGEIFAGEVAVHRLAPAAAAAWRGQNIGFLFQDAGLIERMSALDNVALPLMYTNWPLALRHESALASLGRLGIRHLAGQMVDVLSGGERRRVGFARLLAAPRPLILCDEPTTGLDGANAREVIDMLKLMRDEGSALVVATHDTAVAAIADLRIEIGLGTPIRVS